MATKVKRQPFVEYEAEVFKGLQMAIGLKSMDKKASAMAKKMYHRCYSVENAVGTILARY